MNGVKILIIFLLIKLFFSVPSSMAYEGVVHYAWTYYLALQVGFSERQAYQIASAADAIDWDPETNPVNSPLDIKIDVLFGAERFRYFDRDLFEKWKTLNGKLKESDHYSTDNELASFSSMRKALKGVNPDTMLDDAWKNYYDALINRNPAIRTFVQFHAFQPITLQKHSNPEFNEVPDLALKKDEWKFLSLDSPLANFRLNETQEKNDWWEYLFRDDSSTAWLAINNAMEQPASDKNPPFSKLDSDTFVLFKETMDFCSTKSISECLCKDYNTAAQALNDLNNDLELAQFKPSLNLETQRIACNKNKLSIEDLQNHYTEITRKIVDIKRRVGLKRTLPEFEKFLGRLKQENIKTHLISDSKYLSRIKDYQKHTRMSWPLVYSSLLRDIESYVLNEYWNPTEPKDLEKSHAPTKAVNAVRGNVARKLWKLGIR